MNLKEYMKAKKLLENKDKKLKIKIVERGTGKNEPKRRKQRRTAKSSSNRKS